MTQPKHRPARQSFTVHAGAASVPSVAPEWWGAIDSDVEARAMRFAEDGGNWLEEGQLPSPLTDNGCRLSEVAAVMNYPGLASTALAVGARVLLRPDPQPQDRFAIAVWVEDGTQQIGFLPSDVAAEVMQQSIERRTGFAAFVAGEVRDKESGQRRDLTILLGPGVVWAEETTQAT